MRNPILPAANRATLLQRAGILAIVRHRSAELAPSVPDLFIAILDDGTITGFNSHVDLGTGIRTALIQIVAEELGACLPNVFMMLGDTQWTPDQGPTIASETIQVTAIPLRQAAAQARRALLDLGAQRLGVPPHELAIESGVVFARGNQDLRADFSELVAHESIILELDTTTPVKPTSEYRIVGQSVPRLDIPAKASGQLTFVHDFRLPGMLHGRVVRPPYGGRDVGDFVGHALVSVDKSSISNMPGVVKLVVVGDFIGIVAEREDQAEAAARALQVEWKTFEALPPLNAPEQAIRNQPRTTRMLVDEGDVDAALTQSTHRLTRTYVWPYQMHASIGPCCSVAAFGQDGRLTVWNGTQTPLWLRTDLAKLLGMAEADIDIVRMETAGSFGRSGMDDVGADAALLARAVQRPVRVQLTREQEHTWEPKGTAQLMQVDGGIDASGSLMALDYQTSYPSNLAPTLALLLTRTVPATPQVLPLGDRSARPPYAYPNLRIAVHDMAPIARASFLRGVSAMPTSFAHESFIDELAMEVRADPIEYRLRHLRDPRAIQLVRKVAQRAGWQPHEGPRQTVVREHVVRGQGFAYALYVHGSWPGTPAAWAAWAADVEVDLKTGEVAVTRVVAGQDCGLLINPDGVRHQVQGNVIQSTSRVLHERVTFDEKAVTSREWGAYPILRFPQVPQVEVVIMARPEEPPLGVGESASVPSAAAIANAVFDATGVRFRELPLTPDRVLQGLADAGRAVIPQVTSLPGAPRPQPAPSFWWKGVLTAIAALLTAGTILWPIKRAITPIATPGSNIFSEQTLERGRVLAEAGACAICHTAPGGAFNAGGFCLETPFGAVYSTNITPDPLTGIGTWSYPAFERAMRTGVSRDGHHLYPAFPYTSYTRMTDGDLQALYAWLMAQSPVQARPTKTRLPFPLNLRPLLAGWNGLFLEPGALEPQSTRSDEWNRGAYLALSVGHCSECHTPRNALGGEKQGVHRWQGGFAEGWEAPPLGQWSRAPAPWTAQELYTYLRMGASDWHGPAGGPMREIVTGLRALPDADIKAMATYFASLAPTSVAPDTARSQAEALAAAAQAALRPVSGLGATLFDGACAVCHVGTDSHFFGARLSLALNSNVHAAQPDNLVRIILDGWSDASNAARGAMPAFRNNLDDHQIAELVAFIRRTQAPHQPPWAQLQAEVARIRSDSATALNE